jgi:sugar lactone lactonase YvrE
VELLLDARAKIGECPVWAPEHNAVYWIDVKAPALYRTNVETGSTEEWFLPADVGGYALTGDGRAALVALRSGLFALELETKVLDKLAEPPFDPRTHRFNEVDCDPAGRLWLGVMFEPEPGVQAKPAEGALHSFTVAEGLTAHAEYALTPNGFAWSLDASTMYVAHTKKQTIKAVEFDLKTGRLGSQRTLVELPKTLGVPDGGAVDADGFYWSAIHGGSCLHRYSPDGRLDLKVQLPVKNPTMMAFGGTALSDLYVTSAAHSAPATTHEGGLFRIRSTIAGRQRPRVTI